MLASEAFAKLVKVTLAACKAPAALAVTIKGNPELLQPAELEALAERVFDETVRRLTTGSGSCEAVVE